VASGAPSSRTPVGVYYTTYKLAGGWTTSTYTCRPVVGFKQGSGYAFHSRLYYPNSSRLTDASIGYPKSHGCIRMYDEDINYIYDYIPLNTTVVVH
jgi:lipoprotein-anchoring transpeptidase ErfK/SrfK